MVQQLETVPDVLGGRLDGARAQGTVAAIQGAAPLGAAAQVYDAPPIVGDSRQDRAARHRPAVDPAATVGEQATDRKHTIICHMYLVSASAVAFAVDPGRASPHVRVSVKITSPVILLVAALQALARPPVSGSAIRMHESDSLDVALTADASDYAPGDTIAVRLAVANRGAQPITLHFSSAQRCDFEIRDARGATLWRWGADRMFAQMLGEETLLRGRNDLNCRERLPAPRTPGTYRIIGTVVASDRPMAASVVVTVHAARRREGH
jgi:hypothetical protein